MRRIVLLLILLVAAPASAQVAVAVELNPAGESLAARLGVTPAELAMTIQDRINSAYGAGNVDGFLRSFADATAFSMRGLGVDYASDPQSLVLGIGANVAVAASDAIDAEERPTAGLAANLAFMVGLNLANQGAPRWTLFANGFYRTGSTERLRGRITSAGLHAQYRLVDPQRDAGAAAKLLRWGGIDLTGGVELTRWSLGIAETIETDFDVGGSGGSARITLASTGRFDLTSSALSVPIELTTSIRIALLLSIYLGAGLDVTAGTGALDANLAGTLRTNDNETIGAATVSGDGESRASPVAGRILVGAQLNLWKLKVYAQVNGSPLPAASVGFGIRGVL